MSRLVAASVVAALVGTGTAAAQVAAEDVLLPLGSVMEHRFVVRSDSTRFDACLIHEKLERPEGMVERLGSEARFLDRRELDCETPQGSDRWVHVHEYLVGDSVAHVVLRVIRPGWAHFEDYRLRRYPEGKPWRVEDVRLHGWMHFTR